MTTTVLKRQSNELLRCSIESFRQGQQGTRMNIQQAFGLKTDEGLLRAVRDSARYPMSAEQVAEQRVSFVYGVMKIDDHTVTKDHVRAVIQQQQGGVFKK